MILSSTLHRYYCSYMSFAIKWNLQFDSGKSASVLTSNILFCTKDLKMLRENSFSLLVPGANSYMTKFGYLTKAFGIKITASGPKFRRRTGRTLYSKTNLRRVCRKISMGSSLRRRCIKSLLFHGRYVDETHGLFFSLDVDLLRLGTLARSDHVWSSWSVPLYLICF
jgi:hypothetical protein